ncbi:MAG TPA: type II secretion system ATPase GspE [Planctomycetota bacterium]|nr:type II secretion system ATPase GspE [Planctomycetota bacterium]
MLIGEILIRNRAATAAQVDEALRKKEGRERLGQALIRLGFTKEDDVLRALSEQTHIPYLDLAGIEIDPTLSNPGTMKTIFQHKVLPIDRSNGSMRVALSDPLDLEVLDDLKLLLKAKILPVIARPSEIDRLLKKHYGVAADEVHRMVNAAKGDIQVIKETAAQADEKALAEDAGLVKFVNQIFTEAVRDRASDIHVEPMEDELRIRYRIDGVLHKIPIPGEIKRFQAAIVSRLKIMSALNIAEKRLPQDGRIMLNALGKQIDVRVSVIPNVWGEGVCLRLLDRANMSVSLEELGMPPKVLERFKGLITEPHGILLVTGPTGSGKTTTLYAALQKINNIEDKIITVEDPVEYQLPGIKQIQVNSKIGLTFGGGLRAILRHDPDIIMIGEIRDLETAEIAVQSALTGHLVFSTLHTNDAPTAVTRLVDMGLEPFLVASTVEGLMAQRLVRRICKTCKKELKASDSEISSLLPEDIKTLWKGSGCEDCRGTGYRGRQGVFELLVVDDEMREMILKREAANRLKKYAIEHGMQTLRDDGWNRVRAGVTTAEEVLRITKSDKY